MITIASTEARNHLGKYLSLAVDDPIIITRPNQEPMVIMSKKIYDFLETLEDAFWYSKAMEAKKSGYATQEEIHKLYERLINEDSVDKQENNETDRHIGF